MPRELPYSEAPYRLARELRRRDIEGPLLNDDAGIDRRGLRYSPRPPRLDSRPFSEREIALRPAKRRKRSRSRVTMLRRFYEEPKPAPRSTSIRTMRVGTYLGRPALLSPDGSLFRAFATLEDAYHHRVDNS